MKPFIKYPGGKSWLVETIRPYWNEINRNSIATLIEPFCGSAAMALGFETKYAILNDASLSVWNILNCVQNGELSPATCPRLIGHLKDPPDRDTYNKIRNEFNEQLRYCRNWDPIRTCRLLADLFYYLNHTCYNGLMRFNSKGDFNTPVGRYKTLNIPSNFEAYQRMMSLWSIECENFDQTIVPEISLTYCDPPYDNSFDAFTPEGFGWVDQLKLATWAYGQKEPIIISNSATPRIISLYKDCGFRVELIDGPRSISCKADGRKPVQEVLAFKNCPDI